MNHESSLKKYPLFNFIMGAIYLLIVIWGVINWNAETKSFWGFVYLAIAMPGLFLFFFGIIKRKLFNQKNSIKGYV